MGENYLFCGEEDFLKEEAKNAIISKLLPPELRRLNCDTYNAKDNYRDIFNTLDTLPFLADKRVVIIKDIECLPESKKKSLLTYLKNSPKHIYLILQSSQKALSDRFLKTVSSYTRTYLFKRFKDWEKKSWIYKRLKSFKKSITKEALDLLLELKKNEDLAVLSKELEKLVTYKGEKKSITEEDVIELVGKSLTKRAFDLIEAISFKDRDSALLLAQELSLRNKTKIPEMMGLMGWQLRRIWKAKTLLAQEKDKDQVCSELKIRSFSIERFFNQVSRFNIEELERDFKLLVEADRSIKSGRKRVEFILEQLIIKLCRA